MEFCVRDTDAGFRHSGQVKRRGVARAVVSGSGHFPAPIATRLSKPLCQSLQNNNHNPHRRE
jgi:hypothetical protein